MKKPSSDLHSFYKTIYEPFKPKKNYSIKAVCPPLLLSLPN